MIRVRAAPNRSSMVGPIMYSQYMFKPMCSSPLCSQPALSTVHHRPYLNTGTTPLAPKRNCTSPRGDSIEKRPPSPIPPPDTNNITTHTVTHTPITTGVNPKLTPRLLSAGPNPHSPGFARPHV